MCQQNCLPLTAGSRPAGGRSFSFEPGLDDIGGASDARREIDGPCRAVIHTGAAFHATIKVDNLNLAAVHGHNPVGTDQGTNSAPAAKGFFEFER